MKRAEHVILGFWRLYNYRSKEEYPVWHADSDFTDPFLVQRHLLS